MYVNGKRPRRKPPAEVDAAIALAAEAAGAYAGLPRITQQGIVGTLRSDAYWKAKDAKFQLHRMLDEEFLTHQQYWADYLEYQHERRERGTLYNAAPEPPRYVRAVRFAYWAAQLTEKAAANGLEMTEYSEAASAWKSAAVELKALRIDQKEAAGVERIWRFVVAAGRMPTPADANLLAAFEAAIIAGEVEFATHLAQNGWGQRPDPTS